MTTNFLELATTLKYLGAKWLPEKRLILHPAFAGKPSHYLLFIKLWAATLRLLEIEKASGKHKNGQV